MPIETQDAKQLEILEQITKQSPSYYAKGGRELEAVNWALQQLNYGSITEFQQLNDLKLVDNKAGRETAKALLRELEKVGFKHAEHKENPFMTQPPAGETTIIAKTYGAKVAPSNSEKSLKAGGALKTPKQGGEQILKTSGAKITEGYSKSQIPGTGGAKVTKSDSEKILKVDEASQTPEQSIEEIRKRKGVPPA